jgi:hypothetical protein
VRRFSAWSTRGSAPGRRVPPAAGRGSPRSLDALALPELLPSSLVELLGDHARARVRPRPRAGRATSAAEGSVRRRRSRHVPDSHREATRTGSSSQFAPAERTCAFNIGLAVPSTAGPPRTRPPRGFRVFAVERRTHAVVHPRSDLRRVRGPRRRFRRHQRIHGLGGRARLGAGGAGPSDTAAPAPGLRRDQE